MLKNIEIIPGSYRSYLYGVIRDKEIQKWLKSYSVDKKGVPTIELYTLDEFTQKLESDKEFSERWG